MRVVDNTNLCPLCHSVLTDFDGNQSENMYPVSDLTVRGYNILTRILIFASIVGGITSVIMNYITYNGIMWSVLTVAAILYFWAVIIHSFKHHANIAAKILVQAVCASIMLVIIDFVIGYDGWSVNYVVPNLFSLANLAVLIIIIVNHLDWHNYVMYQIGIALLGFIPIVLFFFGVIDKPLIAIISFIISFLSLLGTYIFGEKTVKSELKRRFHF